MSDIYRESGGPRFDENPVLPSEAAELPVHVEQCAKRYNALRNYLFVVSNRVRWQRVESWVYRLVTLPLLGWIALELYRIRYGG